MQNSRITGSCYLSQSLKQKTLSLEKIGFFYVQLFVITIKMVCKDKDYIHLLYICYKKLENMEYRKLSELHKLDNNPRTIKDRDLAKLMQSIRDNPEYFEVRPLILSNRTGKLVILGGNQRYEASLALGLTEVPTGLIEGLTEEQEKEIIIRDNVNNGEWDWDLLANDWDALMLGQWGLNIWIDEVSDLIEEKEPEPDKMKKLVFNLSESDYGKAKQVLQNIDSSLDLAFIKLITNNS